MATPRDLDSIDQRLGQLSGQIQYGLEAVNKRFDGLEQRIERLWMLGERVASTETGLLGLKEQADRTHEKANQAMREIARLHGLDPPKPFGDGEVGTVTWPMLRTVVVTSVASVGVVIGLLKLLKVL
jgi:hypothetical protein